MKKLAVCEYCGNIFTMGDRVWKYRGDKFCSEDCARKAEYLGKQGKWKNDIDKKEKENKKMKEIKLTIDGKEVQLTDEQLKLLGIGIEEKRKNPFDRVNDTYFCITSDNKISSHTDDDGTYDRSLYNTVNYFNDETFTKQVALHQLLYRKLLKFAYDNECEDAAEWDGNNLHWCIRYNDNHKNFDSYCQTGYKARDIYFSSKDDAKKAIDTIIEPFVKEYPDFVW